METFHEKPGSPGDVLEHYGVKGMRWGVRKKDDTGAGRPAAKKEEPPRELTPKQKAKVEKFLKSAEIAETRISELKVANQKLEGTKNLGKRYERKINNDLIAQTEVQRKHAIKDAEAVKKGKLTRKQKQVIAGAVILGAGIGFSYYAKGQQSGALNSWKLMGQARLRGEKIPFNLNKDLAAKMSAEDILHKVAKPVNPGYSGPGGKMNCRRSTYAYELRRRGFDVHATTSSVGWGQSESGVINALTTEGKDFFKPTSLSTSVVNTGFSSVAPGDKRKVPGAKILLDNLRISPAEESRRLKEMLTNAPKDLDFDQMMKKIETTGQQSSSKKVFDELRKLPDGARGEVMFKFDGFGHSMAFENIGGVPHIFDSQKGTLYHEAGKMVESKWDGFNAAEIRRLDDVDLDLNFLSRWATNVKKAK